MKSNIGHLDAAAGVVGLVKTVLMLERGELVPSLHFENPNPKIDFASSPFWVVTSRRRWERVDGAPRRAGVSSFGIGGTNAHVVLEEAPEAVVSSAPTRPEQTLVLSAKSETALAAAAERLASYLRDRPQANLADVAFTLQVGRAAMTHRRVLVCREVSEAVARLSNVSGRWISGRQGTGRRPVVFLFPGQGSQKVGAGRELYEREPVMRAEVDRCAAVLEPLLGEDVRRALFAAPGEEASRRLEQTRLAQPGLFTLEYALARLWASWGIEPEAMLGHSIGEYVAACLSGVLSLEDALWLVAARGELMQEAPAGAMLAVPLPAERVGELLGQELWLAAVNGPSLCVVSGEAGPIERLRLELERQGVACRGLATSHAFHSGLMDPLLERFLERVGRVELSAPRVPYLSNLTGTWIRSEEATDPWYWVRHLRETVRFGEAVGELLTQPERALVEVGPGSTLAGLVRRHPACVREQVVVGSLGRDDEGSCETSRLLEALGRLWAAGVEVDWRHLHGADRRRRVALPTYPFERQRYWIEERRGPAISARRSAAERREPSDWLYAPVWRQSASAGLPQAGQGPRWLVFEDEEGLGARLSQRLADLGREVVRVRRGEGFASRGPGEYALDPSREEGYAALVGALCATGRRPAVVAHLWSVGELPQGEAAFDAAQASGFHSLVLLGRSLAAAIAGEPVLLAAVSSRMQSVAGERGWWPEKATLLGLCKVLPQEYPNLSTTSVDVVTPQHGGWQELRLVDRLVAELEGPAGEPVVAYRDGERWVQGYEPLHLPPTGGPGLRQRGVYLITGGLGQIGLTLAGHLARTVGARLVLTGRSALPPRQQWEGWLAAHGPEEPTGRKLARLLELERLGAEVMVAQADVADRAAMRSLLTAVDERFGELHGVVHAAGALADEAFPPLRDLTARACEWHFGPKARGLYALDELLAGRRLDFCLLMSSLSAVLGGLGFAAYAAANAFMDAFAQRHGQLDPTPWLSVDWDAWRFDAFDSSGERNGSFAIRPGEGAAAFQDIVAGARSCHLVVSTRDLEERLRSWVRGEPAVPPEPAERQAPPDFTSQPRPSAAGEAPASGSLEHRIAEVWRRVLGIERIGADDNFFDLGGDSLSALQVVSLLRKELNAQTSVVELFEGPTVGALARLIAGRQDGERGFDERLGRGEARRARLQGGPRRRAGQAAEPVGR